jgi:tRNA(Arg) A34 adenosine deaminase TadA
LMLALEEARKSYEEGGLPIGAVMVETGRSSPQGITEISPAISIF